MGVAVSRLTRRCIFRELITTPKLPDFLVRKLGDFLALSLIFLPYILPNLLNGVQTIICGTGFNREKAESAARVA